MEPFRPFAPDSKRFIGLTSDGVVSVYDAATGNELYVLNGHNGMVDVGSFASEDEYVFTASTIRQRVVHPPHSSRRKIEFGVTDGDGRAILWNLNTRKQEFLLGYPLLPVVVPSYDLHYLAVAMNSVPNTQTHACSIYETHVFNMRLQCSASQFDGQSPRLAGPIAFDPNSKTLVTVSRSGFLFWRLSDGNLSFTITRDTLGAGSGQRTEFRWGINDIVFSIDGELFAIRPKSKPIQIWSTSGCSVSQLPEETKLGEIMGFDQSGQKVVVAANDGSFVSVCDTGSGRGQYQVETHDIRFPWASISPDGRLLAVSDCEGGALLYDVDCQKLVSMLKPEGENQSLDIRYQRGFRNVPDVFFSPDGRLLATGKSPVRIWEMV